MARWQILKDVPPSDNELWHGEIVTAERLKTWYGFEDYGMDELDQVAASSVYIYGPCAPVSLRKANPAIQKGLKTVAPGKFCKDCSDAIGHSQNQINKPNNPLALHHFHIIFPEGTIIDNSLLSNDESLFKAKVPYKTNGTVGSVAMWRVPIANTRQGQMTGVQENETEAFNAFIQGGDDDDTTEFHAASENP